MSGLHERPALVVARRTLPLGGSLRVAAVFSVAAFVAVLLLVPKSILHADRK